MSNFELMQNELLLHKGKLKYIAGRLSVTPRDVYLTSSRFVVCKQHLLVGAGVIGVLLTSLVKSNRIEIEIPLKDIVSMEQEKYGLRGKKTVIETMGNKEIAFLQIEGIWIDAIKEAVKNSQPNIKIKTNGESVQFSE